jgi:DNA ligase 4
MVFKLLFPEDDVARKYDVKETHLARYLCDILGVSEGRGARLRSWSVPQAAGCLGGEVKKVMEEASAVGSFPRE